MNFEITSFFAGAGGLDLGFKKAGFNIIWANEFDSKIWETYEKNHPDTKLDKSDLRKINIEKIPTALGIIGGPPCQSWSEAGAKRGINDNRGQLFFDYIDIISKKQPLFFLAENVSGMFAERHNNAINNIIKSFESAGKYGYNLSYKLLNVRDFGIPQDRKRVFFIGYRKDLSIYFDFDKFIFENKVQHRKTLKDAIYDLKDTVVQSFDSNITNNNCIIPNHEFMTGNFSTIYMSRNRVRGWDEQSFTIQAGGRHAPIHPQAPKMIKVAKNKMIFVPEEEEKYRRLSVRECARIQTFPDDFIFYYKSVPDGYKMVGNAVPVHMSYLLAKSIKNDLEKINLDKNYIFEKIEPFYNIVQK